MLLLGCFQEVETPEGWAIMDNKKRDAIAIPPEPTILEKLLAEYKKQNTLIDDYQLTKNQGVSSFVQAWTKIHVKWVPPEKPDLTGLSRSEIWNLMFKFCNWESWQMSIATGISEEHCLLLYQRAKMLRLIFPDGTIGESSRTLLEGEISKFRPKNLRRPGRPKSSESTGGYKQ